MCEQIWNFQWWKNFSNRTSPTHFRTHFPENHFPMIHNLLINVILLNNQAPGVSPMTPAEKNEPYNILKSHPDTHASHPDTRASHPDTRASHPDTRYHPHPLERAVPSPSSRKGGTIPIHPKGHHPHPLERAVPSPSSRKGPSPIHPKGHYPHR